jgi:hypothetical protein
VISFTTVGILRTLCGQHSNLCGKPTAILGKSSLFQCEMQFLAPGKSESRYKLYDLNEIKSSDLNDAELGLGFIEVLLVEPALVRRSAAGFVAPAS